MIISYFQSSSQTWVCQILIVTITFNENAKGFFNVRKVFDETFENERTIYKKQIETLKDEIAYLRNKLDEKNNY